ncbi:hypothetical protein [Pseudovibrio sp. POLY-S9]|uniref:hypothetical protein n=1 Tax=Pseudovibrio sp. POLY-S9 TaxID=1576596 RepID=UPI00070E98FD|nr:hypothetical protein [Pseudovibrio sp. POLY-S9]
MSDLLIPATEAVVEGISGSDLREVMNIEFGTLSLYLDDTATKLLKKGFLNFTLKSCEGDLLLYPIHNFQQNAILVRFQESLNEPNASCVMNVYEKDGHIVLYHWEGFLSVLERQTMKLVSQSFTK